MSPVSVVLSDHDFTADLKARDTIAGVEVAFPRIDPVHDAFDDMVRTQRYDVCEMAIGAFLQARAAGKPLRLLPVVMVGGFQHRNLYASPKADISSPADLAGATVGVRSYSQTTGLWVRGWIEEEYGLAADAMSWAVTEGSHSGDFHDPGNVRLIDGSIADALYAGRVDAAILGRSGAPDLAPLVADHAEQDRRWFERHGCVPVNHLVTVTDDLVNGHPEVVREVYRALGAGIARSTENAATSAGGLPPAVRSGLGNVRTAVELAAGYAHRQGLVPAPVGGVDALFAFTGEAD
ncbi:MAG TPA: ABC transporter substrate-binding protein [Streptosporangiaceae bacterium]|jgi:4,5-dihydroxyphthalate decarboxylase